MHNRCLIQVSESVSSGFSNAVFHSLHQMVINQ